MDGNKIEKIDETDDLYDSKFLKVSSYFLIFTGLWPLKKHKLIYCLWSFLIQFYFVFFMVTFIIGFMGVFSALTLLEKADLASFLLIYAIGLWKMQLIKKEPIKKLIRDVASFEKTLKDYDETFLDLYEKENKLNVKLIICLPLVTCICYFSFVNASVIDYINWMKLEAKGLPSGKHLKFPELLPKVDKYFTFYFFYQEVCGLVGGVYVSFIDSLILSFINYTVARIRILGMEMNQLFLIENRSKEETARFLRSIVIKHLDIISHVNKVNANFKWFFFIDFALKSYHITLILVTFLDESTAALFNIYWHAFKVMFCVILFTQVTILYYCANNVSNESVELGTFIYKSKWYGQPVEITRTMLIMMSRTVRALKLESFGVVTLSNELSVKIYQATVTYVVLNLSKRIVSLK